MMPRDVGLVMGHTGASGGDRVLDAGTGSGILAAYLGRAGADVTSYEIDSEFAEVARGNMVTAGVADRVEVRTGDLTEELDALADEDPFDVLTLDTGDAPKSSSARTTCSRPEGTSPSTPRSSRGPARPPSRPRGRL